MAAMPCLVTDGNQCGDRAAREIRMVDASADPELAASLAVPDYAARSERAALIRVEAFDWNCPQHITPRFTHEELEQALASVREEIESLRAENQRLRHRLNQGAGAVV